MDVIAGLKDKAKSSIKTIVLPEGTDERILQAAWIAGQEKLANIIIIGKMPEVIAAARKNNIVLSGNIRVLDHLADAAMPDYINEFYELRRHKETSPEQAKATLQNPIYFAAMMVRKKRADGFVAGACTTTSDVARAAIYCLGVDTNVGTASSCFLMIVPDCPYGEEGVFVFGDCGIVRDPSARQMASIAISSARLFRRLIGKEPKVALLSYSSKGSGAGDSVNKVVAARNLLKDIAPTLWMDGELQADAAIVPEVAARKVGKSSVAGSANVLIFPNLDSGNISYKLVQRLARAQAVGPLLLGLNYPCADLSRGCSINDIVNVIAVTAIRAQ